MLCHSDSVVNRRNSEKSKKVTRVSLLWALWVFTLSSLNEWYLCNSALTNFGFCLYLLARYLQPVILGASLVHVCVCLLFRALSGGDQTLSVPGRTCSSPWDMGTVSCHRDMLRSCFCGGNGCNFIILMLVTPHCLEYMLRFTNGCGDTLYLKDHIS